MKSAFICREIMFRKNYFIEKKFQTRFILEFLSIVLVNAVLILGIVYILGKHSYSLLPDGAAVLVQVDTSKAVILSQTKEGGIFPADDEGGTAYFPLKEISGKSSRLYNAFDLYLIPVLAVSFLNLIVITVFGIFFSHRMAGPIHRIRNTLAEFNEMHSADPITLRKKDFFQDLASLINRSLELKKKENDKKA